ncbi:CHAT domain-containing protein [Vitiosangium sp. GDMCC 1.1324]|uniref:nSTAND1 domain-containing NTPase n=1 Tax=Vitiosangium sp. (strain GDMCC 1.1324) TaxID=2138576 RepID=UPI000D345F8A|nr:CHAT domain-containing protein [Vitiosangium sp. GDMCC 1.1324]PTL83721.1 hypothetical protein DAT35_09590 [Vitiosangium sp. GDMCC 1.1324]
MRPASAPHAEPFTLTLELTRGANASAPFAFQRGAVQYLRRLEDGSYRSSVLDWDRALLEDLAALEHIPPERSVVQRLGDSLRTFLEQMGWDREEAQLLQALREERPLHITLRFAAAELYALPWELLTLRARGQHLSELPACTLRYEWLGASCRPPAKDPRPAGGRILFAWSAAGGDVPARLHLQALRRACERAGWPFDEDRDVLPHVSLAGLAQALAAPGEPVAVLHLLCHGSAQGETSGLLWNESPQGGGEQLVDGGELRQVLEGHAGSLRLVVLCACQSGGAGGLGNSLGSVALALHRIGLEAVVASRLPLSVAGSVLLTRALYERMLGQPGSLEESLAEARARLARGTEGLDWASLQLYAYAREGFDTRPLVFRPYRGLLPLEPEHGRFFFGPRELARQLLQRVLEAGRGERPRFQLLVGVAGSGKSTVVRAGLLPSLPPGSWEVARVRPGESVARDATSGGQESGWPSPALAVLARALRLPPAAEGLSPQAEPEAVLVEAIRQRQQPWSSLLLVVESLEEVFTQLPQAAERQVFVRALWKLSRLEEAAVVVLVLLRAEYLERCVELPLEEPGPRLDGIARSEEHQLLLPPPEAGQLLEIIQGPARQVGLVLEDGLAEVLLREVEHEPDPLPLLAYTLDLLWERREGRRLTLRAYADLGGVAGALAWRAERLYQELGDAEKHAARRLLVALVEFRDEARPYTRRRARPGELRPSEAGERQAAFDRVLECFLSARLLTWQQDPEAAVGEVWVQVAHEALIRRWELLRRWVHEASALQGELCRLQDRAREWARHRERRDGGASHLLTGDQLHEARRFQARHEEEMTPEVNGLITASSEREQRRRRRVRWGLASLVAGALLVAGVMAALAQVASTQRVEAEHQQDLARRAQDRARLEAALTLLDEAPARALLLLRSVRTPQVLRSPRWSMAARAVLQQPVSSGRLHYPHEQFTAVAFDEAATELVIGTARGLVLRWSRGSQDAPRVVASTLGREIRQVGFSGDGKQVFALGGARLRRWNRETNAEETSGVGASLEVVALSAQGHYALGRLVTPKLRLMSLKDGTAQRGELRNEGWRHVALSEDPERQVLRSVVATTGREVWLQSVGQDSGRLLCGSASRPCGDSPVYRVAIHPDESQVATIAGDGTVRVWDVKGTYRVLKHSSPIKAVAFSPKGEQLAVGLEDGTVHLWHTRSGRRLAILRGHELGVEAVAFNVRGELASASRDGTVLVWRVELEHLPLLLEGDNSPIEEVAFAPDAKQVATLSEDGRVRVWPVEPSQPVRELKKEEGSRVWRVGFSSKGEVVTLSSGADGRLATRLWGVDGQVRSWSPSSEPEEDNLPEWLLQLGNRGNTLPLRALSETPAAFLRAPHREVRGLAGQLRAMALAEGGDVVLGPEELRPSVLQGHTDSVRTLAFAPDEKRVATASKDGTVRIWREGGMFLRELSPPGEKSPFAVAWDLKGSQLAVSGRHGLVLLWRTLDAEEPELLPSGHTDEISAMAFSPQGELLLTGSTDGTARVWPLQLLGVEELQQRLNALHPFCLEREELQRDLSEEEVAEALKSCEQAL